MSDMEKIRAEIGARIKVRRLELNMTQEELAAKVGFKGKTSIAKIESGAHGVPINKAKVIADVLDTTPDYIMGW